MPRLQKMDKHTLSTVKVKTWACVTFWELFYLRTKVALESDKEGKVPVGSRTISKCQHCEWMSAIFT